MINTDKFPGLAINDPVLFSVRTAIEGSPAVKRGRELFLPNPSTVEYALNSPKDIQQRKRYEKYIKSAEFEDYTAQTQDTFVGKLALSEANIEVPAQLEYLLQDSDGDGLSFANGLLGNCARNVSEAKWHIVVADYQGLIELDVEQVSIADAEKIKANARVKFKEYPRESLIKYNVSTRNGIRQVDYMMLRECGFTFNPETGVREEIKSFLVLAVDEQGYYQQKIIEDGQVGEKVYISAMDFIPFWVFSDEELKAGDFPCELGYLSKISELCYQRYIMSADFKEVLSNLLPTTYIGVGSNFDKDAFTTVNGRSSVAKGESNFIPSDSMSIQTEGVGDSLDAFFRKFEETKETLKSYGAYIPDNGVEQTATKARIDSAQQNAVLLPTVDNLIEGAKALFLYAGIFEGVFNAENTESAKEQITVAINKDFENIAPTADEVNKLVAASAMKINTGLSSLDLEVQYLIEKGCYPSDMTFDDVTKALLVAVEG
ncbi:MAG: hypothetical protein ACTJHE_08540 [Vibrio casei]